MVTIQEAQRIAGALTGARFVLRVGGFDVPIIVRQSAVHGEDATSSVRIEAEITTSGEPSPARVEAIPEEG